MKLTKEQKKNNKLEKWFDGLSLAYKNRVIWCAKEDGEGFDEEKTSALHEALALNDYRNIPSQFNKGYVVHYKDTGKNKTTYKDPFSPVDIALIDPDDILNTLTEKEMALLQFRINKYQDIVKPSFPSAMKAMVAKIKTLQDEWFDVDEAFGKLKQSEQAGYLENIYFEKKSFSTEPIDRSIQVIDNHYDSMGGGWNSKPIKNVTEGDVLKVLQLNWNYSDAPLDALVNNLQCHVSELIEILHMLKEKGWVTLNLTDMGTGGEVSLTSSGRKLKSVNPKEPTDIYQKRINAIRKDLAREPDGERKVMLKSRLQDVLEDQKEHGQQDDPVTLAHKRRLHELKKKQALSGFNTDVSVILEIQDIERELGY